MKKALLVITMALLSGASLNATVKYDLINNVNKPLVFKFFNVSRITPATPWSVVSKQKPDYEQRLDGARGTIDIEPGTYSIMVTRPNGSGYISTAWLGRNGYITTMEHGDQFTWEAFAERG